MIENHTTPTKEHTTMDSIPTMSIYGWFEGPNGETTIELTGVDLDDIARQAWALFGTDCVGCDMEVTDQDGEDVYAMLSLKLNACMYLNPNRSVVRMR